jgi:hypothetical protein
MGGKGNGFFAILFPDPQALGDGVTSGRRICRSEDGAVDAIDRLGGNFCATICSYRLDLLGPPLF